MIPAIDKPAMTPGFCPDRRVRGHDVARRGAKPATSVIGPLP